MSDLIHQSATAIAHAVNAGSLSPEAMVDASLAVIARRNGELRALTHVAEASARQEARIVRDRLAAGERLPLAGVPMVVKDNIWVKDLPITQGSRSFADFRPPCDAIAVARARQAGAIVIGIGACPEFASKGFTNTAQLGITRHPTHPDLTPGGSSGGNVTAVAAGFAPISIGTDGGGSSRRPPAHCGLVGFKPTFGAIPHPHGFAEPFWNITCLAPIARDVADTALLFGVLAGPHPADPESRPIAAAGPVDLAGLTIAVAPMLGLDAPVDADVLAAFNRALTRLSERFSLRSAAPDWPAGMTPQMLMAVQHAGLAALHADRFLAAPENFDPDIGAQIRRGLTLGGAEVAGALETSLLIRRAVAAFFLHADILVSLTTPCTAWPHDRTAPATIGGVAVEPRGHAVLTPMFNHAQVPAISIPCGFDAAGLPVGLQIVGPVGADWKVLAVAAAFEQDLRPLTTLA